MSVCALQFTETARARIVKARHRQLKMIKGQWNTPQKINIEPENDGFQKEPSLWGMVIPSLGNPSLGGGFKYVLFSPLLIWERFPIWLVFFRWVGSTTNQSMSLPTGPLGRYPGHFPPKKAHQIRKKWTETSTVGETSRVSSKGMLGSWNYPICGDQTWCKNVW